MGVIAAVLVFLSVLAHELAHALVALRQGIQVQSIRLFIFGGVAQVSSEPRSGRHEFLIALAGPACNMIIGSAWGCPGWSYTWRECTGRRPPWLLT